MADLFFGGGLNETDPFNISPDECIDGQNFVLDARRRNFRRRQPQDLKGTTTNAEPIRGIMQMIDRSNTMTTLVKAGNVVYSWDGSSFTSERTDTTTSSRMRATHWALDDLLIVTDITKQDPLYKWDGTDVLRLKTALATGSPVAVTITRSGSVATVTHTGHGRATGDLMIIAGATQTEYNGEFEITVTGVDNYTYTVIGSPAIPATGSPTADVGVELKAKYAAVKDNRIWMFNINTDNTELPHVILASTFEEPEIFDTSNRGKAQDTTSTVTGSDPFVLFTPDLKEINGVAVFFKELVISTVDGALYRLVGTDPTDYNFVDYYNGSAADAQESMINIGNDVVFTKRGGDIDRLSDTERSGDVAVDDLSRFIPSTKLLLADPIAVYDQTNQRACWFENGFVLVYDKDVSALAPDVSPWMKWTTLMPNQFQTEAVAFLSRPGGVGFTVYWGDQDGNIYDLNGVGQGGDSGSLDIEASRKLRYVTEFQSNIDALEGRVQYQRTGACDLVLDFEWGEEYNTSMCLVPLKGPVITGDPLFWGDIDFFWNEDDYWNSGTVTGDDSLDNQVSTAGFSPVGRSPGFFMTLTVSDVTDFLIDKIQI